MDPSGGEHMEMHSPSLEIMLVSSSKLGKQQQERIPRPQPEQALIKCPRCDSTYTKFCYYNNYSLSQPRYYCKSCRRYWTKGGNLRNIPMGGGCRKTTKKSSSSKRSQQDQQQSLTPPNYHLPPWSTYDTTNDLTLNFGRLQKQSGGQLGFDDDFSALQNPNLRSSFVGSQNYDFQNYYYSYYYGFGNEINNMGELELVDNINADGIGIGSVGEIPTSGDDHLKQELHDGATAETTENRMLWGLMHSHSQLNNVGDQGNAIAMDDHLDSSTGRQSWNNGLNSSNCHGLLNSPLL